jgi:hypothetical protein
MWVVGDERPWWGNVVGAKQTRTRVALLKRSSIAFASPLRHRTMDHVAIVDAASHYGSRCHRRRGIAPWITLPSSTRHRTMDHIAMVDAASHHGSRCHRRRGIAPWITLPSP